MVVFVDYDSTDALNKHQLPGRTYVEPGNPLLSKLVNVSSGELSRPEYSSNGSDAPDDRSQGATSPPEETANQNAFSAALNCYPVVKEIARSVDLNTLHALAGTCRQFHTNITPFRHQLIKETLHCENEYIETLSEMLHGATAIPNSVKSVLEVLREVGDIGKMMRGKVGKCARDMVGECRRCSRIVCRNCTIKAPSTPVLKNRVRRLCVTCRTAPLDQLLSTTNTHSPESTSPLSDPPSTPPLHRTPCFCGDIVWLCSHCGQAMRSSDTTYRRVWAWRTRYSTYLGGIGTGIGEGCQGVKCGRGEDCLAAREIEMEVDCEDDTAMSHEGPTGHEHGSPPDVHELVHDSRDEEQPGYFRQEIVGIGGVVKQKAKKRVAVGDCVVEYEDERETGRYLVREEQGYHRSWCAWCWRVIPARDETVDSS